MRSRTVFQTWFFISCFLFIGLMTEFGFYTFGHQQNLSLHRIMPVTSLPLWLYPKLRNPHRKPQHTNITEANHIRVILKNRKELSGKLVSKEGDWLVIDMDGSEIGLKNSEILQVIPIPDPSQQASG